MAPDPTLKGMNRAHQRAYLVCKAGGGLAASTFHSRFVAALKRGATLEDCLEKGDPGPAALRRVSMAGSRNRARILMMAAEALGMPLVDSVPDQSSRGRYRGAVTHVDVVVNAIRKLEDTHATASRMLYQYTTAVDAGVSQGLMSMSNAADGVVLLLSSNGEVRQTLRNEAGNALPYSTLRLRSDRDLLSHVAKEYKAARKEGRDDAHPDHEFLQDHFTWKNRVFGASTDVPKIEPLSLWGSYHSEEFLAKFSRPLGVAQCQAVRLRPAAVCVAGVDAGKLRAAVRNIVAADA